MTRKDFCVLASILAKIKLNESLGQGVDSSRCSIDNLLSQANPNYNAQKFWDQVEFELSDYIARYSE